MSSDCLFKFGVIADVQYADIPDGSNYSKSRFRYYRKAMEKLERASVWWKEEQASFVINLGDTIDGHNKKNDIQESSMERVLTEMKKSNVPVHSCIGNHELLNFSREQLRSFGWGDPSNKDTDLHYAFNPIDGWKFIVLDSYFYHVILHNDHDYSSPPLTNPEYAHCREHLVKKNPNLKGGEETWNTTNWYQNLDDDMKRYLPYNGLFGAEQLQWVSKNLAESKMKGEKVVLCTHSPFFHEASNHNDIAIDSPEMMSIIRQFPDTVVLVLAGHNHDGGFSVDDSNVPHVTFPSPLETDPAVLDCSALIEIHKNKINIIGRGAVPSRSFDV